MFRVEKVGRRWMFLTAEGHPFWMRAVYAVDWNDGGEVAAGTFRSKYRGDGFAFAQHAARRLKAWGFNTLGEYSTLYAAPVPTFFRPSGNPERGPFIRHLNISWYGALDQDGLAPGPFKTLLAGGGGPGAYKGWPGHPPDTF